jgi:enoyl-CoA hydratase/carnithine racemase
MNDALLLDLLPSTFHELASDMSARVIVLTGSGGSFCSGADLDTSGLAQPSPAESELFMRTSHQTVLMMRSLPQPIIAAIDGHAVGAGIGLALACDIRYGSATVKFSSPFLKLGLPPDWGTTYLTPAAVGTQRALEIFLTGRVIEANEAQQIGLISRVCDDVLADALELAEQLASNPPIATSATKRLVYGALDHDIRSAVLEHEVPTVALSLHSEEFKERFGVWVSKIRR